MLITVVNYLSRAFKSAPETREVSLGRALLDAVNKSADDFDERDVFSLIEQGADTTLVNGEGMDAALLAAWHGHTNTYKKLIRGGVNPDHENHLRQTALMIASEKGHGGIVDFLVDDCVFQGRRPDAEKKDYFGERALSYAIREGHTDIATKLESRMGEKSRKAAQLRAEAPTHYTID